MSMLLGENDYLRDTRVGKKSIYRLIRSRIGLYK